MGYLYPPLPFFTSCGLVTVQHGEAWCRVVLPRPAAMAESSACERGNDVGQTSILDRRQFLQFAYCSEFIKRTSPCSASYISCQRGTARICRCSPVLLWRFCCWAPNAGQQSIDISRPPGAQQQTCRTLLQRSIDGTDGRRDGRNFFSPTPAVVSPAVVLVPHNIVLMCLQLGSRTCNPRQFRYLVIVERHDSPVAEGVPV